MAKGQLAASKRDTLNQLDRRRERQRVGRSRETERERERNGEKEIETDRPAQRHRKK